jgi:SEC-C motif
VSSPDRNAPCPCGSGKKYKRCCALAAVPRLDEYSKGEMASAWSKLVRFGMREENRASLGEAEKLLFSGREEQMVPLMQRDPGLSESMQSKLLLYWLADDDLVGPETLVTRFLDGEPGHLTRAERRYLADLQRSHLAIYEIQEVLPGVGCRIENLWWPESHFVTEKLGTQQMKRWDLLIARLIHPAPDRTEFDGDLMLVSPAHKQTVLDTLKRDFKRASKVQEGISQFEFSKQYAFRFHHLWMDLQVLRPMPKLVTTDGEPLVLVRSAFDVLDRDGLVRLLDASAEMERDGEDPHWRWIVQREQGNWLTLGKLELTEKTLIVETMSKERAERAAEWLASQARGLVSARMRMDLDPAQAIKQERETRRKGVRPDRSSAQQARRDRAETSAADPELQAAAESFLDQQYHRWIDEPVPALGGKTPRQAAASKRLRPKLIDLLKSFENSEERFPAAGGKPYDFGWIWRELGLELPT